MPFNATAQWFFMVVPVLKQNLAAAARGKIQNSASGVAISPF